MARRTQDVYIRGTGTHRRTESDYMSVLLDTVALEDWQDVVAETLRLAKGGDPAARAWLGQFLVGRPEAKAPTPLTVVVQQWSGIDPVAEKLARPIISRELHPMLHENDAWEASIEALVASELAQKLPAPETAKKPATAGDSGQSAA
jgi:hypothetical protein